MAIDFPASPTEGQEHIAPGSGYVYQFSSGVWTLTGTGGNTGPQGVQGDQGIQGNQGIQGPPGVKGDTGAQGPKGDTGTQGPVGYLSVSDTAPMTPAQGQLWWNSTNGYLYVFYDDGDSSAWVQINMGIA